jgi:hypothetical protein
MVPACHRSRAGTALFDLETGLSDTALAQELANPIANLTSVPFQNNFDFGGGRGNAFRYTLNVQPVIPFTLNDDWNLITRTIIPFAYVERVFPQPETGSRRHRAEFLSLTGTTCERHHLGCGSDFPLSDREQ